MDFIAQHWVEIAKLIGELTAAMAGLAAAIVGLCSILVNKIIPILSADHPALGVVKFLGKVATLNESPVKAEDRPTTETKQEEKQNA